MNIVKSEVMQRVRAEAINRYGTHDVIDKFLWDEIMVDLWVQCENSLGLEHMYYADVEGWILEVQ